MLGLLEGNRQLSQLLECAYKAFLASPHQVTQKSLRDDSRKSVQKQPLKTFWQSKSLPKLGAQAESCDLQL